MSVDEPLNDQPEQMAGWERLLYVSDSEIRGATEDTIDELYAFLLTNRISEGNISGQPSDLKKILERVLTILRLKDAEFQEVLTAYDENQKSSGGDEHETKRLRELVAQQETRIRQLETYGGGGAIGGREVIVLRQEVDDLRSQLAETKQQLDLEKLKKERLHRELSSEHQKGREMAVEISLKREEVEGFRNKLTAQQSGRGLSGGVLGVVEEELRERLKTQERDMAEQLDRIEELISDKHDLEQKLSDITEELTQTQEEKLKSDQAILKHQEILRETDDNSRRLQNEIEGLMADVEHFKDQLNQQKGVNQQLTELIEAERQKYTVDSEAKASQLTQYKEKLVQLDNQLRILLQDTNKSQVVKLTKDLEEREKAFEQLEGKLLQASEEIVSLSDQLEEAKRLSNPTHANRILSEEIEGLKTRLKEGEHLFKMEQERRQQIEKETEKFDHELIEARQRLDQYERGHVGLREAVMEIKQRKLEVAQRDSEIAKLIQQVNSLQSKTDTLYDENEALRHRLGMGPDEAVDLEEIRSRKEQELRSLREENENLLMNVEKLEEEKLVLRKKLVDESFPSRPTSKTPSHSPGKTTPSNVNTPSHAGSSNHVLMADLNAQISHLQSLLETERKKKESCRKEISRLSKELTNERQQNRHKHTSSGDNTRNRGRHSTGSSSTRVEEEVDYGGQRDQMAILREENVALQARLDEIIEEKESMEKPTIGPSFNHIEHHTGVDKSLDQLSVVVRELKEREKLLKKTKEQLELYKRKFEVIIHQQGVLYKEYNDAKIEWEGERDACQHRVKEAEMNKEQYSIKTEELESLQRVLDGSPDEAKRKLGEMSRRVTKLRVNERVLLRQCSLSDTIQAGLRKEVTQLKQSISEMEVSCREQISYLQRFKEAACFKISSLQKLSTDSVPLCELEETKEQLARVSCDYQSLLTSLIAGEMGQSDERIRELNKLLNEYKQKQLAMDIDLKARSDYESTIATLERNIAQLRQDNSKLKERAAILELQIDYSQNKGKERDGEVESLQKQVKELSSTGDHKATIGQLQQQIIILQQSEANMSKQLQMSNSKLQEQQAQLLRAMQLSSDKEDSIDKVKIEYATKIQRLNSLLLSHQRMYSGASFLMDHAKLYSLLVQAKSDKDKASVELRNTCEERTRVQDSYAQLAVQQRNLQELIDMLKSDKDSASLINKVTEWHSKLGEMRLKEMQQQRTINGLEGTLDHLKEQLTSREKDLAMLEQRLVQSDKRFEDLSLCLEDKGRPPPAPVVEESWSHHDEKRVTDRNTETVEQVMKHQAPSSKAAPDNDQFSLIGTIAQLQSEAVRYETRIRELEMNLSKDSEQSNHLRRVITELEGKLLNKDTIIAQLEHRLGIMEERLVTEGKEMGNRSENTIKLATDTLEQIQVQLAHKEKQLERYQELLQEARREHLIALEEQRQETDRLRGQLELTNQKLMEQKKGRHYDRTFTQEHHRQVEEHQQQKAELQKLVKQLESSNGVLNEQLEQRTLAWEGERSELIAREEQRKRDSDKTRMKFNVQIKELQGTLTVKEERIQCLEDELEVVKGELASVVESSSKSPSKSLQGLVGKLRVQLTEKEKQMDGLKKALQQVRNELLEATQKTIENQSRQGSMQLNIQKMVNQRALEVEKEFEEKIRELDNELVKKEQLLEEKSKEVRDFKHKHRLLEEKLTRIEKALQDRTIELEEAENELIVVRNQLRESQTREEKARQELKHKLSSSNKELVEVKEKCSQLQSRVDQQTKHIKKLQEETKANSSELVSHRDPKNSSVEIARWEEGKKWQKKLDSVKTKLTEKSKQLETVQRQLTSMRETVTRTEREKGLLQEKLKSMKKVDKASKAANVSIASGSNAGRDGKDIEEENFTLRTQIYDQNNQIADLQRRLQEQRSEDLKQLEAENHLLKRSNEALQNELKSHEQHHAKDINSDQLLQHETHLRQELVLARKQYTQLHFRLEQSVSENMRLKTRVDELEQFIKTRNISASSGGGSGQGTTKETKPGSYTAAEVDKVVSAMKKVIERLQNENDLLKRNSKRNQTKDTEMENQRLKEELQRTKQTLASLGEGGGNGDTPLMTVIAENERLRMELKKEMEKSEKLAIEISRMKTERNHLKQRLSEFSEPQEEVIIDRDRLRQENTQLKKDLEAFDPQFFEEIEDLKYKYQESLRKNAEYEDHIQLLTSQYGLTHHQPVTS